MGDIKGAGAWSGNFESLFGGSRRKSVGLKAKRSTKLGVVPRLLDTTALLGSWAAIFVGTNITEIKVRSANHSWILVGIVVVCTLVLFDRAKLYQTKPTLPRTEEISRVSVSVVGGSAAVVVADAFLDWRIGAWELLWGVSLATFSLMICRGLLRNLGDLLSGHHEPSRILIVGTGEEARELADVVLDHPETRLKLLGVVGHLPVAQQNGLADLWIGPTSRLIELMHIHQATGAIVTPTGFRAAQFREISTGLLKAGFDVQMSTGVSRLWEGRFEVRTLAHEPLVMMGTRVLGRHQLGLKRLLDVVGASVILVLASPVILAAAIAIKLEDGGPVFFRQHRAGRKAEPFGMLKFRSMVTNAEELKAGLAADNERTGPLFKVTHDPRITRVGRIIRELSIDELPQLVNVIKGDMSLVGPRPALDEEEKAFDDELRGRFDVRPGITGLWQVEARSNASFAAYRRLDLHYVENWTVGLDIRILMATVEQVVVTAAMIPARKILSKVYTKEAIPSSSVGVIDLRDKATEKLAARPESAAVNSFNSTDAIATDKHHLDGSPADSNSGTRALRT